MVRSSRDGFDDHSREIHFVRFEESEFIPGDVGLDEDRAKGPAVVLVNDGGSQDLGVLIQRSGDPPDHLIDILDIFGNEGYLERGSVINKQLMVSVQNHAPRSRDPSDSYSIVRGQLGEFLTSDDLKVPDP